MEEITLSLKTSTVFRLMTIFKAITLLMAFNALQLVCPDASFAQAKQSPKNLQVLPDSISREELMGTMKHFTEALGVRCQFCHVGEEGMRLSEFDFASDSLATKRTARLMMKMTHAVNSEYLSEVSTDHTNVMCITCHRGYERPVVIQQVLAELIENESVEAALARFDSLRQKYYGSGGYDFREAVLTRLAADLQRRGDVAGALSALRQNSTYFPDSIQIKFMMALINEEADNSEEALRLYKEILELDPENEAAQKALERLK